MHCCDKRAGWQRFFKGDSGNLGVRPGLRFFPGELGGQTGFAVFSAGGTWGSDRGTRGQTGFRVFSCVWELGVRPGLGFFLAFWRLACLNRGHATTIANPIPGAIYHFMARGNGRQDIVYDDHDRQRLMDELARCVNRTSWQVFSFVILSDRLHLVLKTPESNLARSMQCFLSSEAH